GKSETALSLPLMIMINHHDYRDQERNDANDPANCVQRIAVGEANRVRAVRNDQTLKSDVCDLQRRGSAVDRCLPVAMWRDARDEKGFPISANADIGPIRGLAHVHD